MLIHIFLCIEIIFGSLGKCIGLYDKCSPSNINDSLKFSKKLNDLDYFQIPKYGELFCCAHGYDSLLWYKNNILLVSNKMNILFKNNNQSMIVKSTKKTHEGYYTCIARKGDQQINHTVIWKAQKQTASAYDKKAVKCIDCPKEIYYGHLGDSILLTCEIYFGIESHYYTPNIIWRNLQLKPADFKKIVNITQNYSMKTGKLKSYLYINPIKEDHFGDYECHPTFKADYNLPRYKTKLAKGDDPQTAEVTQFKVTSLSAVVAVIVIVLLGIVVIFWKLEIQVFWHSQYGQLEIDDGKDTDILISYANDDEIFAMEILHNHLENILHFRCLLLGRNASLGEDILHYNAESLKRSRRFAVVMSPAYLNNGLLTYTFKCALHEMLERNIKIFFILYKDISLISEENENDEPCLKKSIGVIRKIRWPGNNIKKINRFWKNIILQLPPKRSQNLINWLKLKLIGN